MKIKALSSSLLVLLLLIAPLTGSARGQMTPLAQEELADTWEEVARALRDWAGRARDYFSVRSPREERPLISFMLRNRDRLGLSADQARKLEQLRNDFERESIRRDADLRVAEIDLANLTEASTVDMGKVDAKVREIERLRADQRLARIRTIEKGKEQLTADQRKKLQELLTELSFPRPPRAP